MTCMLPSEHQEKVFLSEGYQASSAFPVVYNSIKTNTNIEHW
jgi:hypothetical protein